MRTLCRERIINSYDGDDLAFQCMIGFRKFTAYLDPFLPLNVISRKAYNTIMVEGLEGMGKNLIAIVKDVYVFFEIFTYITDFIMQEDIGEFFMSDMTKDLMGRPIRKITKLKYDVAKGLVSFAKIFHTYTAEVEEDDRPHARFLGGKISSGRKKSQELSDGDNIGDRSKIVGGAIGACGGIGKKASAANRSLVKSFEGSREVFPSEAGK
nr:hypothetical protein [Tanacetum cinerariifolium]